MLPGLYPEPFQFPGGEWDLRAIPTPPTDQGRITLIADVRGAALEDLMKAMLWADVADRANWGPTRLDHRFVLMIPYLPAARADRGTPCGGAVYARLIRAMTADTVITLDPHSPVVPSKIPRLRIADHDNLLLQALNNERFDGIIAPDKGAVERAGFTAHRLGLPLYLAEKQRDFETGKLSGFRMTSSLPDEGRLLIVDDICDGGGTFRGLADHLLVDHGVTKDRLGLWVTHGVFSGAADKLREHFSWIGTTDSHPGSNRIGVAHTIVPCFMSMYEQMTHPREVHR